MPKKKKRSGGGISSTTVARESLDVLPPFISVRVLDRSSSLGQGLRARLSASDAVRLNVKNGEKIIVVGKNSLAILNLQITKQQMATGTMQLDSTIMDCLFGSSSTTAPTTPLQPQTPVTPVTSTSAPSSEFSFRQHSPDMTPSGVSTPSRKRSHERGTVITCQALLGRAITESVTTHADSVCVKLLDESIPCNQTVQRLILAQLKGAYLQESQICRVSIAGKAAELKMVSIDGTIPAECELELTSSDELDLFDAALDLDKFLYMVDCTTKLKLVTDNAVPITNDRPNEPERFVAGLDATLDEVRSLLHVPLFQADLFQNHHLAVPKGILLFGSSGVGKTALAKQIASLYSSQLTVNYVHCSTIQSKFSQVGEAERYLHRLFDSTGLLILDDVHLVCPKRGSESSNVDRLTSTMLALMDGVTEHSVVILALTSNPSALDPALRRPGRLDTELEVPLPDEAATRAQILQFHVDNLGMALPEASYIDLARMAKGFNGADCMLAVKEAVRLSILGREEFSQKLLRKAIHAIKPSAIKSITVEIPQVRWSDIGGMDQVKRELREAIELPLAHSDTFEKLKLPPPRGILLYGPPGCSKTLMARALATEGQMNFLAVKGPELLSKWLGESERALASLFRRARMASPSIIFFDEMDAIASRRGDSANSSGRLLSQLLTELDGVTHTNSTTQKKQRVVVVGATNRPDLLDSALTRPGRMDRKIYVGVPDSKSREMILSLSLKDRSCGTNIDIPLLASDELTQGFSGAEIVAICRDAALIALEESDNLASHAIPKIEMRHLLHAVRSMQRQITPEMVQFYKDFKEGHRI